jgi:hypothetical protein
MYSVNLKKKTEQHAAQAPALHERIYPSKFCGSLVVKSIKRSVINIGRSMFDVRCSTFNLYALRQCETGKGLGV